MNVASKCQGQANPVFTYTATGFVNGDGLSAITNQPMFNTTCTTTNAFNVPYGPAYAVTASGAVAPNYNISYVPSHIVVVANPVAPPIVLSPVTPAPTPSPVPAPMRVIVRAPVKVVHHAVKKVVREPVKKVVHVRYSR